MKKLAVSCGLLLFLSTVAFGQNYTTVSATLQDSAATVWASATWTTEFSKPPGVNIPFTNHGTTITANQTGLADGSGHFSVVLDDNLQVSPAGSGWKFTICPNATVAACNTIVLTITGASQDVSSQINAILSVPSVNSGPIIARAYTDSEANGSYGALYINSSTGTIKQCGQLQCSGTGWVALSGASGVTSVFGRSGAVVAMTGDYTVSQITGAAPLASPTFTGVPAAPTAAPGTNTTQLATTAFVLANAGGGGNVSNSGTPLNHQVAIWTDATHIQGITPSTSGFVLTSNGTGSDPTFQAASGGSTGFPAQSGAMHQHIANGSATISADNTYPQNLWSKLGGTYTVQATGSGSGAPPQNKLTTNTGTAGGSASLSEDAVSQQMNFGIWSAYACYCEIEASSVQIAWLGYSTVLYGSNVAVNPNAQIWGFRFAGGTDTNFQAYVSTNNTTFTAVDTGVAASPAVWHGFAMAKNGSGGIDYYIDGTKVATIASGATGFPATNTNAYTITEDGLLSNGTDPSIWIGSIRSYYKY